MAPHYSILAWKIPWTVEPGAIVHGVARVKHYFSMKQQGKLAPSKYNPVPGTQC